MKIRLLSGIGLIALGVLLVFRPVPEIDASDVFAYFWPLFFVIPFGVIFHWWFFRTGSPNMAGLLVPGGIFLTVGVVSQLATLFDAWKYLWPGLVLAPAVGLFELYLFGGRQRGLLIPVGILAFIAGIFFISTSVEAIFRVLSFQPAAAALLILAGIVMLFRKDRDK
jgi:hypothetical protein